MGKFRKRKKQRKKITQAPVHGCPNWSTSFFVESDQVRD